MNLKEVQKIASKYIKFVEWSDEDNLFVGRCPELFFGGVHGNDPTKVYQELSSIVEDHIQDILKEKIPPPHKKRRAYSGKFVLRLDPQLHRAISLKAEDKGISLNQYVLQKLQPS